MKKIKIVNYEEKYAKELSNLITRNLLEINSKDYGIEKTKEMTKDFTVDKLKETLSKRKKVYVALINEEVVGTAGIDKSWYSEDEYWILTVFVKPENHKQNIGKKLIQKIENYAKRLPIKKIVVPASITANEFYYKLGYNYKDGKKELNKDNMYIMEKILKAEIDLKDNNFSNINRISIIGGPGTGKSTLANNLGKELNLPVCHIDGIHHLENWKVRDKEERDEIILNKIKEPKWIMDGTYKHTLEKRIENSDMVIFLNFSKTARVKGILSRYIKNKGKEKSEIPGCKEQMNFKFIKQTLNWEKDRLKIVNEALEKNKNNKIIVFKTRRKLNKWYEKQFNKKIEV